MPNVGNGQFNLTQPLRFNEAVRKLLILDEIQLPNYLKKFSQIYGAIYFAFNQNRNFLHDMKFVT